MCIRDSHSSRRWSSWLQMKVKFMSSKCQAFSTHVTYTQSTMTEIQMNATWEICANHLNGWFRLNVCMPNHQLLCCLFQFATPMHSYLPSATIHYFTFILCLSVLSHISETHGRPSPFLHISYGRGSVALLWWHCNTICTSGFVNNVMAYHIYH